MLNVEILAPLGAVIATKATVKFPFSIPSIETLSVSEKVCHPLGSKITKHTKQNQELDRRRGWMLPMLMNGQA